MRKDKPLLNKLAVGLDRTSHRVIKDWKGLARTEEVNAPHDVWLRCGINSVKSCTQLLFNVLTAEFMETTLEDMINALTSIRRNDVKRIITNCYRSMFLSTFTITFLFALFEHVRRKNRKMNK